MQLIRKLNESEKAQVPKLARGKQYKKGELIFLESDSADTVGWSNTSKG